MKNLPSMEDVDDVDSEELQGSYCDFSFLFCGKLVKKVKVVEGWVWALTRVRGIIFKIKVNGNWAWSKVKKGFIR